MPVAQGISGPTAGKGLLQAGTTAGKGPLQAGTTARHETGADAQVLQGAAAVIIAQTLRPTLALCRVKAPELLYQQSSDTRREMRQRPPQPAL